MKPKMATVNAPFCKNPKNDNKMHFCDIRQVLPVTVLGMSKPAGTYHTCGGMFQTPSLWLRTVCHGSLLQDASTKNTHCHAWWARTTSPHKPATPLATTHRLCTVRYFIIRDIRVGFWLDASVWGFRPCIFDVDRSTWYRCFFWHIHTFWQSTTFIWFRYW